MYYSLKWSKILGMSMVLVSLFLFMEVGVAAKKKTERSVAGNLYSGIVGYEDQTSGPAKASFFTDGDFVYKEDLLGTGFSEYPGTYREFDFGDFSIWFGNLETGSKLSGISLFSIFNILTIANEPEPTGAAAMVIVGIAPASAGR